MRHEITESTIQCQITHCIELADRKCEFCGKHVCDDHLFSVDDGGLPGKACVECTRPM